MENTLINHRLKYYTFIDLIALYRQDTRLIPTVWTLFMGITAPLGAGEILPYSEDCRAYQASKGASLLLIAPHTPAICSYIHRIAVA